jgi:hypothetical protein
VGALPKGPLGLMLMLIGGTLAAAAVWQGAGDPHWSEHVPTLLIGLALTSFGYSIFDRARRKS